MDPDVQLWMGRAFSCMQVVVVLVAAGGAAFAATKIKAMAAPPAGPWLVAVGLVGTVLSTLVAMVIDFGELDRDVHMIVLTLAMLIELLATGIIVVGLALVRLPRPGGAA